MKRYHIADVLTLLEVIAALVLAVMTVFGAPADVAIWVFIAGELFDAFDGICARKWHYPDDGKKRWWRTYAPQLDQASDVLLATVCGLYLITQVNRTGCLVLIVSVSAFCTIVELLRILFHGLPLKVILFRRYIYVFAIAWAIIVLVFATSWRTWVKELVLGLGVAAGIVLVILKRNRLTQDKTPL